MYFKKFKDIFYEFTVKGKPTLMVVKDITTNVRLRKAILENITLFDEYDLKDGETPEIVAAQIYGSPEFHWVVMLCNQRFDYLKDFPMTQPTLLAYTKQKYGDAIYETHHYEKDGFIVNDDVLGATAVNNYEYEDHLNESKRRIKLISPQLLGQIMDEFKRII